MELRQLRYVVTLAEELHFGRAAAREHIVQSALSQQIRRLEREVGVPLFVRDTHRVNITPAGEAFLAEALRILARLDIAVAAARDATDSAPVLRAGVGDASFDSMLQILETVQSRLPTLEIRQVEAGVPEQCRLLVEGRLDIGFGRASAVPDTIASELVRMDPMGVAVAASHPYTNQLEVPFPRLATETVLLAEAYRSPEYNSFVLDQCRVAGFMPKLYRGTVQSMRAAADLISRHRCVMVLPSSCSLPAGVAWVLLVDPRVHYPFSLLWCADQRGPGVDSALACARKLSQALGWLPHDEVGAAREADGTP